MPQRLMRLVEGGQRLMRTMRREFGDYTFVSPSPEGLMNLVLSSDPEVIRRVFWEESELSDLLCGMIDIRSHQTIIDDVLTLSNPRGGIIGKNSKIIAEGIQGAISDGAAYRFARVKIFGKLQCCLFAGPYHFYWGETQEQVLHQALRNNCAREEDPRKEKLDLRRFRDAALVREAVDTMREREMDRIMGFYHLFWRTDPFIGGNHQKLGITRVERFGEPVFVYVESELSQDVVWSRLGAELEIWRQPPLTLEEVQRGIRRGAAVLPALYELEEEPGRATLRRGDWSITATDRAELAVKFCQYLASGGRTLDELSKIMFAEDEAAVRNRRTGGLPEPWDGLPVELLRSWVVDWQVAHGTVKWRLSDVERSCIGAMYGAEVWYQGRYLDEDIIEYLRGWSRQGWDNQADLSTSFEEHFVDLVVYDELRFDVRLEDLSYAQRIKVSKEVERHRRGVGGRRASLLDLVEQMLMFGQKFDRRVRDQVVLLQWANSDWWDASRTLVEATDEEVRQWSASSDRDVVVVGKSAASVREVVRCLVTA